MAPDHATPCRRSRPARVVLQTTDMANEVVRVDGTALQVSDVIRCLDGMWRDREVVRRLVELCLIRLDSRRLSVEVRDDDVQDAMDALRRGLGLHSVEATHAWLAERGLDHDALETWAMDHALVRKVRDLIVGQDVVDHHCRRHATVRQELTLLHARFRSRSDADAAFGGLDVVAAPFALLDRGCHEVRVVKIRQPALPRALRHRALSVGDIVDHTDADDWIKTAVVDVRELPVDERTRDDVATLLFEEYLTQRLATAHIEWCWGS
jgi:putative peptide maturation system protein